ncbi:MAG: hypothetical protein E7271_01245 [Lachnospiraceae bacterium]|jgi:RimJ/RimL family protein N-acetyltransferase|nr:hypothetical protein [Lachnospiraceae bacterium]
MEKMQFKAVELKFLSDDIIKQIRNWRNQDFVRLQMFTQDIIGEKEHIKWVETIKKDENRHLFVFFLDDKPFAVVQSRYYPEYDYVETGDYLISTDYQALGYGTFLKYYTNEIMYYVLNYNTIHGEILDTNKKNINVGKRLFNNVKKVEEPRIVAGEFHDVYIIDSCKSDWENNQKRHLEKLVNRFIDSDIEIMI